MARTILVPIDFCVASINTLKLALEIIEEKPLRIILLYAESVGDSIAELLFYSPHRLIATRQTPEFREAMEILANRFQLQNNEMQIRLLPYDNARYVSTMLDNMHVDDIYLPKSYRLRTRRSSFNPVPLLKKTTIPIHEMDWVLINGQNEQEQLTALFN